VSPSRARSSACWTAARRSFWFQSPAHLRRQGCGHARCGPGRVQRPGAVSRGGVPRLAVSLDVVSSTEVSGHQPRAGDQLHCSWGVGASTSAAGFCARPAERRELPVLLGCSRGRAVEPGFGHHRDLGDSITDGRCSTRLPDGTIPADQYNRWTDVMAARLQALYGKRAPRWRTRASPAPSGAARRERPCAVLPPRYDVLDRAGSAR